MLRKTIFSCALILGTASTAMAENAGYTDWSGFYAGGSYGTSATEFGGTDKLDSKNLGAHAGYLFDLGSIVVGGEVDYENTDVTGQGDKSDANMLRVKGRVGYDAGSFMPYATAGAARLKLNDDTNSKGNGYFYGVGTEFAVNESLRISGEVLQHEFKDFAGTGDKVSARTMSLRASYSF